MARNSLLLVALCAQFTLSAGRVEAAGAQMSGGRLSIGGTDISESFTVNEVFLRGYMDSRGVMVPGGMHLRVRIVDNWTGQTLVNKVFLKSAVASITVMANGGDDYIEINTDVGAGLFGGDGMDEIFGGTGDDYIDAGYGLLDFIHGGDGDDVLYSGAKWYLPFVMSPMTEMYGDGGNDTFIYRNSDYLVMDDISADGWAIAPDFTYGGNNSQYAGMHQISE